MPGKADDEATPHDATRDTSILVGSCYLDSNSLFRTLSHSSIMPGKADDQATLSDATRDLSIDFGSCISNTYKHISSADSTERAVPISTNALLPLDPTIQEALSNLARRFQADSHTLTTNFGCMPTEITVYIMGYLHPSSILNFVLVHKYFFTLSEALLEKRRQCIEDYAVFRHADDGWDNIPYLLKEIAQWPNTAYYVRHLTIRSWRDRSFYESSKVYTSEVWAAIRDLTRASDLIPEDEKEAWISTAEKDGDQEPLVALLLLQLTHVKTITMECPWRVPLRMLHATITRISSSPLNKQLRRLHTVTLDYKDAFGISPLVTAFAGVRSVQSLLRTPYSDDWVEQYDHLR